MILEKIIGVISIILGIWFFIDILKDEHKGIKSHVRTMITQDAFTGIFLIVFGLILVFGSIKIENIF